LYNDIKITILCPGVDDAASECDLDAYNQWDHVMDTSQSDDGTTQKMLTVLQGLIHLNKPGDNQ